MPAIPRTVREVLDESLRDEIVRGDFAPGEYLRLEEIAARFDVSTMPVREALRALEAGGLVITPPHRGAVVTQFNADEFHDTYDIGLTLEEMACHLAVPRVTEDTLAELTSLVHQREKHEGQIAATLVKPNLQFQLTLYAASDRVLRYCTQHHLHLYR